MSMYIFCTGERPTKLYHNEYTSVKAFCIFFLEISDSMNAFYNAGTSIKSRVLLQAM